MSKLMKRKSIVLVGKRAPTHYEIQQENKKEALEVSEKTPEEIKNKKNKIFIEMKKELEALAMEILKTGETRQNLSNRDFMNCVIVFQFGIMNKMFDLQEQEDMDFDNRSEMVNNCGAEIRKLVKTYTDVDTHNIENYI